MKRMKAAYLLTFLLNCNRKRVLAFHLDTVYRVYVNEGSGFAIVFVLALTIISLPRDVYPQPNLVCY